VFVGAEMTGRYVRPFGGTSSAGQVNGAPAARFCRFKPERDRGPAAFSGKRLDQAHGPEIDLLAISAS